MSALTPEEKRAVLQKMYAQVQDLSGMLGPLIQGTAGNDVFSAGLGGALQGFSAGPLGALAGGAAGLMGAARRREEEETRKRIAWDDMMSQTSAPSYYAKTGAILAPLNGEGAMRIQAQKGEVAAMPNGMIADVMSRRSHKEMKADDVTDVLPAYTIVGDEKTMLRRSDAEKVVLGVRPQIYTESGKKNREYSEMKLSDMFTSEEMSVADVLRNIRRKIKIPEQVEDEVMNPWAHATADDNSKTRMKYVNAVMELAARKNMKLRRQLDAILNQEIQEQDADIQSLSPDDGAAGPSS